jgi:hypothetical protein
VRSASRFLHDTAIVFHGLGIPKLALDYAKRSLEILRPFGAHYVSRVQELISGIESEQETSATEVDNRLRQLRSNVANARDAAEKARHCDALTVDLLYSGRAAENIEELHAAVLFAFDYAYKQKDVNNCLAVLAALLDLYFKALPLPAWAENAARSVVALAEDRPNLDWISQAHGLLATALIAQDRYSAALVHALTAVARHDQFALQTETSMIRSVTNKASSVAREIALESAMELGDAALAAELIESARLQVLPDSSRSEHPSPYVGDSITGHMRDFARSRLASLGPYLLVVHQELGPSTVKVRAEMRRSWRK